MDHVWFHLGGCEQLIRALRQAAAAHEDLADRVRAALAEMGEESAEASEIDAVARWCEELADELRQRVDFVVWVDESLAFHGLVSVADGVARGVLPFGGLPARLDGELPTDRAGFQQQAAARAGLDLDDWDPADGFEVNRETVLAVYDYYLDLHRLDDCLQ